MTNGTAAMDYSGDGTLDTNITFSMNVAVDYSSSGPLGANPVLTDQFGDMPGYVHVAAEFDTSANLQTLTTLLRRPISALMTRSTVSTGRLIPQQREPD